MDNEYNNNKQNEVFDKEQWAREKVKEKEDAFELIDSLTEEISNSDEALSEYFDLAARFPNLGTANSYLPFGLAKRGITSRKGAAVEVISEMFAKDELLSDDGSFSFSGSNQEVIK